MPSNARAALNRSASKWVTKATKRDTFSGGVLASIDEISWKAKSRQETLPPAAIITAERGGTQAAK
jgi:hypothetical protein